MLKTADDVRPINLKYTYRYIRVVAKKTLKAKIVALTHNKQSLLEAEYNNLQHFLQTGEDNGVYSANKQQAKRFYKIIKPDREYPLSIRNDLIRVEHKPTTIAEYWMRIPIKAKRGGLWVAIKPHQPIPDDVVFCESKIHRTHKGFFACITIEKDIPTIQTKNILAVDLGEKVIATVCGSFDNQRPRFYGRDVRGIRRHYSWLRKRLGEKKLLGVIRRISDTEKRKVNDSLHKISRKIVDLAQEHNATIVLGELQGIRNHAKGRRMNRIVSNMPYLKLSQMIEYKAEWLGIPVIKMQEHDTSKTCSRCNEYGKRPTQAQFRCDTCHRVSFNADYNGALNILKRATSYMGVAGADCEPARDWGNDNQTSEATQLVGW